MIDFQNAQSIVIPEGEVAVIARGDEILWQKSKRPDENTLLLLHGEDFVDSSKYARTIVNNNVVIADDGKFGKCFYISKNPGHNVETWINHAETFNSDFTIDYWVKPEHNGYMYEEQVISNVSYTLWIGEESGRFVVRQYDNGNQIHAGILPHDTFTHVAVVRCNNVLYLFINGVLQGTSGAPSYTNADNFCIGGRTSDNKFSGWIDEFRLSNVARWTSDFTPPSKPYE